MKKNLSATDRMIRLGGAAIIAILFVTNTISIATTLGMVLAGVGAIFLFTGAVNWCALYSLLGISTNKAAK